MASHLSPTAQKFEIRRPPTADGLFVTGIWSVIAASLGTFVLWLLL